MLAEHKYQHHEPYGDQRPPKVVAADQYRVDEFQIYNDYVSRMTQRHALIMESAKRDRIQVRISGINGGTSLERARQEQQERDSEFLKQGGVVEAKNFLQKGREEANGGDVRSNERD